MIIACDTQIIVTHTPAVAFCGEGDLIKVDLNTYMIKTNDSIFRQNTLVYFLQFSEYAEVTKVLTACQNEGF